MLSSDLGFAIPAQILKPVLSENDTRKQRRKDPKSVVVVGHKLEQYYIDKWPQRVSKDVVFYRMNKC